MIISIVASALLQNWLEMQILVLYPGPKESETLGM